MIYTDLTKKALTLMFEAHKEQLDKSGLPYVFHPFHLAEQMKDEATTVVALLHDVVEDTDYSIEDIEAMGFGADVCDALRLLTHDKSVPYMDYIRRIKNNPIAKAVKIADLKHNSDLSRLDAVGDEDEKRAEKYREALRILTGCVKCYLFRLGFSIVKTDENYLWYKRDREKHVWVFDNEWMARYIDAQYDVIEVGYDEASEQIVYRAEIKGYWSADIDKLLNYEISSR